jgi:DNA-binding PadR family transcriptional regulator
MNRKERMKRYDQLTHAEQEVLTIEIVRNMEAHGYVYSLIGPDGERRYKLTEKGRTASEEELAALERYTAMMS